MKNFILGFIAACTLSATLAWGQGILDSRGVLSVANSYLKAEANGVTPTNKHAPILTDEAGHVICATGERKPTSTDLPMLADSVTVELHQPKPGLFCQTILTMKSGQLIDKREFCGDAK